MQARAGPGRLSTLFLPHMRSLGMTSVYEQGLSGTVPRMPVPAVPGAAGCLLAELYCTALLLLLLLLMRGGTRGPGLLAVSAASGCSAAVTCCTALLLLLLGLMHRCLWVPALEASPSRAHCVEALLVKVIASAEVPATAEMKPAPAACSSS